MVKLILKEIFPKVREQVPDAELHIVGASPSPTLLSLIKSVEGLYLHSDVPEMIPYLQSAQLFLHPHIGGSGIQNKLLEAMACGCPVVTTSTGIQGIDAVNRKQVLIGNTPDELTSNTIEILTDRQLAENISRNARDLIVRTHSWELVFDAVDNILLELFATK
jgi:glycosyltransferase involved in cell wall biosynthesis